MCIYFGSKEILHNITSQKVPNIRLHFEKPCQIFSYQDTSCLRINIFAFQALKRIANLPICHTDRQLPHTTHMHTHGSQSHDHNRRPPPPHTHTFAHTVVTGLKAVIPPAKRRGQKNAGSFFFPLLLQSKNYLREPVNWYKPFESVLYEKFLIIFNFLKVGCFPRYVFYLCSDVAQIFLVQGWASTSIFGWASGK